MVLEGSMLSQEKRLEGEGQIWANQFGGSCSPGVRWWWLGSESYAVKVSRKDVLMDRLWDVSDRSPGKLGRYCPVQLGGWNCFG